MFYIKEGTFLRKKKSQRNLYNLRPTAYGGKCLEIEKLD